MITEPDRTPPANPGDYEMEIVIVNFSCVTPAISSQFGAVVLNGDIETMVVPENPASTPQIISATSKLVSSIRVVDVIVLQEHELISSPIRRTSPRRVSVVAAVREKEPRVGGVIGYVMIDHAVNVAPCRNVVALRPEIIKVTMINPDCMRVATYIYPSIVSGHGDFRAGTLYPLFDTTSQDWC